MPSTAGKEETGKLTALIFIHSCVLEWQP
jgi:hypothetical protein